MYIGAVAFMLPISLINKLVYTKLTDRKFQLSSANWIDLIIFALVSVWYYVFALYTNRPVGFELFGERDNNKKINLMRNIILDIETSTFHTDYLLAAITALYWFRCLLLLKLSENFGPLIEMVYAMVLVFSQFIVLYLIELVTFSSVAAFALTENPNFANLF